MATVNDKDDEYEVPLHDQRYFGSGLKRKRIQFVPSTSESQASTSLPTTPAISAADRYLSIVLRKQVDDRAASAPPWHDSTSPKPKCEDHTIQAIVNGEGQQDPCRVDETLDRLCDICNLPIRSDGPAAVHESSIAHQVCLTHSFPPSHVDRTRKGLAVLQTQGWDPDSRLGLGAEGEGRLHPVKAAENLERAGIGAKLGVGQAVPKPAKHDAGKVRQMEIDGKNQAERLRNAFYRSEEVERYFGQEQINPSVDLKAFKRVKGRRR